MLCKISILILIIITLAYCGSNESENNGQSKSAVDTIASAQKEQKLSESKNDNYLIIKGKDIWVRDVPATGNVVAKLNEGDKCKILEKGNLTAIKGRPDYWYKIELNQVQGWVFGSQTNLMLFQPTNQPITGSLNPCSDPLFADIETPAAYSYSFKADYSFQFMVAAGYTINGSYSWAGNNITMTNLKLNMDTPDGNTETDLKGQITFSAFTKDNLVCLILLKNQLVEKTYMPAAGCFCLGK